MADVQEYQRMKEKVERLQREADRSEGALAQVMARLKAEYGCETIQQAEAKLDALRREASEAEAAFDREMAIFKERWADVAD